MGYRFGQYQCWIGKIQIEALYIFPFKLKKTDKLVFVPLIGTIKKHLNLKIDIVGVENKIFKITLKILSSNC